MAIHVPGTQFRFPASMPVLSRGRHRNARRGACFMEFASYLAGEKWSDHPSCTHPALATLARLVNDWTSDSGRSRLSPLIPSVVGLVAPDDEGDRGEHLGDTGWHGHLRRETDRLDLHLAILAATAALPVASEVRQRSLSAGLLRAGRLLLELDETGKDHFGDAARIRVAFDLAPHAEAWARAWDEGWLAGAAARYPSSITIVSDAISAIAVAGIGEACITDSDERLYAVLAAAISSCEATFREQSTISERARSLAHA